MIPKRFASAARLKIRIDPLDKNMIDGGDAALSSSVYDMAAGDAQAVPWADLKPKPQLQQWLASNHGNGRTAVDIACGLGDNAEAMGCRLSNNGFRSCGKAVSGRFSASRLRPRESTIRLPISLIRRRIGVADSTSC
ncbi:MAG: hypothetical protein R3D29_12765 [Nitratireductor sp.]